MASFNDAKHAKLLSELVLTEGDINDLWVLWLKGQILGATTGKEQVNDLEHLYLDEQLIAAGQLQERWYLWLATNGHTQSHLNDRWYSYWTT